MNYQIPTRYKIIRFIGHQHWLRWSIRYRFLQLLNGLEMEYTVPFLNKKYSGNLKDFIGKAVFFWGMHEREHVLYMLSFLSKDSVVLDIGGNVGHHSLAFSTVAKVVHAFEPYAPVANTFESQMKDNNVTNVVLHRIGLGDKEGSLPFYAPTGDNLGIGSFTTTNNPHNELVGKLPITTGDAVVNSLKLERVDFIKIDAERLEKEILIGLKQTIFKYQPILEIEYTPNEFKSRAEFMNLMPGYTPFIMKINRSFLFFFNRPKVKLIPFDFNVSRAEVVLFPPK